MNFTGPYQCKFCASSYDTPEHRDRHEQHGHKKDVVRPEMRYPIALCRHCSAQFLDDISLTNHMAKEHSASSRSSDAAEKQQSKRIKVIETIVNPPMTNMDTENFKMSDYIQVKV